MYSNDWAEQNDTQGGIYEPFPDDFTPDDEPTQDELCHCSECEPFNPKPQPKVTFGMHPTLGPTVTTDDGKERVTELW